MGSTWLGRTVQSLTKNVKVLSNAMPEPHEWGTEPAPVKELVMLRSEQDISKFTVGSDRDIGGKSTAELALDENGYGRFFGELRTQVSGNMRFGNRKVVRSGYAGMRTMERRRAFGLGKETWNTEFYQFLHVRLRQMLPTPSRFYVNLQTDSADPYLLFQHRLWMHQDVGTDWQDVLIPFCDFTTTKNGNIVESQIQMDRRKLKTVGISVLGPGEGPFDLRLAGFRLCNVSDSIPPERVIAGRAKPAIEGYEAAPMPAPAASH